MEYPEDKVDKDGIKCDKGKCDEEKCDEEKCDEEKCDKEKCDKEKCDKSADLKARFTLEIPLKGKNKRNKEIVVLMFNPSNADKNCSDPTTNRLINGLYNKYSKMTIINISPLVGGTVEKLKLNLESCNKISKECIKISRDNRKKISKLLGVGKKIDFLIATGNIDDYIKRVKKKIEKSEEASIEKEINLEKKLKFDFSKIISILGSNSNDLELYCTGLTRTNNNKSDDIFSKHPASWDGHVNFYELDKSSLSSSRSKLTAYNSLQDYFRCNFCKIKEQEDCKKKYNIHYKKLEKKSL